MNTEFIIDEEETLQPIGGFTGWEMVVFQVEDEPEESAFSTAAIAP